MVSKQSILLVDDEKFLLEAIAFEIEEIGFEVVTASSVAEAKAALAQRPFNFVLSDVRMPKETGDILLNYVVQNFKESKVILMSGYSEISPEQAKALGALGLIPKPFQVSEFQDLIS